MVQSMKYEIVRLQEELNNCKLNKEEVEKNKSILASLYDQQVIYRFGNLK